MNDTTILSQIFGTAEGIFWTPLLQPGTAEAVCPWLSHYEQRGLGFGGDRPAVEALRRLTAAGYLATAGQTQGKSHRLTVSGLMAARAALGLDHASPAALLDKIIEAEAESKIMLPGTDDQPIVMAWHLVSTAGPWLSTAQASDAAWRKYQHDLAALSEALAPLLVLGLVNLFTDVHGRLWGVCSTEAGRSAEWPDEPHIEEADLESCWTAFEQGYDHGLEYARRPAPADFHAIVARLIPASKWF